MSGTRSDMRTIAAELVLSTVPFVMRALGRGAHDGGVTHQQMHVLGMACRGPGSLGEIAAAHGVTPATASALVSALEERGWVTRGRDAADGRRVVIESTGAGREVLRGARAAAVRAVADVLGPLSEDEAARLIEGLRTLQPLIDPDGKKEAGRCP